MDKFKKVLQEMSDIHTAKNHDYGASTDKTYEEFGLTAYLVRMSDKLNRAKTLVNSDAKVSDEKMRDTLIDLAVYSAMAVASLDDEKTAKTNEGATTSESQSVFDRYLDILKALNHSTSLMRTEATSNIFSKYTNHYARIGKMDTNLYFVEAYGIPNNNKPCDQVTTKSIIRDPIVVSEYVGWFLEKFPCSTVDILNPFNHRAFIRCIELLKDHSLINVSVDRIDSIDSIVDLYTYTFQNKNWLGIVDIDFYS